MRAYRLSGATPPLVIDPMSDTVRRRKAGFDIILFIAVMNNIGLYGVPPSPLESSNQLRAGCIQQQQDPRRTPALQLSNLCGLCTTLKGGTNGKKATAEISTRGSDRHHYNGQIYISIIMQHVQQTEKPMGGETVKRHGE